ncbi:MAG: hypothetical protein IK121_11520 [Lachnospiraceae bacterium]|nr:hypothetical protein [Lachnospiraceae bacterium]
MGVYNGKLSENSLKYGLQYYVKKNNKNLIEIVDNFNNDKVRIGFRAYDASGETGAKVNASVDFFLDIPSFEVLCHNIITGNFSARIKTNQYEPIYRGSVRDGKIYSRVLSFQQGNNILITAHEGLGSKTKTGAVTPQYKLSDTDHTKVTIAFTPDELKAFALAGKRALDSYYLHYFGRE